MARPLRLEFAGALYPVTSRGGRREDIYLDDEDRTAWLDVVGNVCARFNWIVHAYCQMTNHYRLLVETVDGNLSKGMRQKPEELREVSKAHRRCIALPIDDYRQRYPDRNEAMARAYLSGACTMSEIGAHFGVQYMRVSRAVRRLEQNDWD